MRPRWGVLNNRAVCALALIFCLVECVWSWTAITKGWHRESLVDMLFFGFVIFITVSIAYRSSFWADRAVFGAIAGAYVLVEMRAAHFSPAVILAISVAHALMWTLAAFVSLIALARDFGGSVKTGASRG
jgi:hypothetical protein